MLNDYFLIQLPQSVKVALPLNTTKEVISLTYGEICPIPGVSPNLLGVVNQRGKLLWVLDFNNLLKILSPPDNIRPQDNLTLLVLNDDSNLTVPTSDRQVGCVVSTLKGVVSLDSAEFQPLPTNTSNTLQSLSVAIAVIEQEKVAVMDIAAIFNNIQTEISFNLVHNS